MASYRITELGRRFGLSRSTLLYYDRIGLLQPSGRSASDHRLYTDDDLKRLERICLYRGAGVGLHEIARLLDAGDVGSRARPILERRLRDIGREMDELRAQQRLLAGMLQTVSAGPEACGLDADLWHSLQTACGLDAGALKQWHREFERRAPQAHHQFLLHLGLSEKEALQVRMLTRDLTHNTAAMKYFYELFEDLPRQGPGCREATLRALAAARPHLPPRPRVLDIGCGRGVPTQILARELRVPILAIDNHRPMLDRLDRDAREQGLDIETRELSMIDMPFEPESFDLLWAEGSMFIIGVERGLRDFRAFLPSGGVLAFSDLFWFDADPPAELRSWIDEVCPEVFHVDEARRRAEALGWTVLDVFHLPEHAWWDDYYTPMQARLPVLRKLNAGVAEAATVYAACEREIEMYRQYPKSYGYAFFVLRKG